MADPMTPERIAQIRAEHEAFGLPREVGELLDEVERLQSREALVAGQVEVTRRACEAETDRAAYDAMDRERRSWQSRQAVENVAFAELRRERDEARAEVDRLRAELDGPVKDEDAATILRVLKAGDGTRSGATCLERVIRQTEKERDRLAEQVRRATDVRLLRFAISDPGAFVKRERFNEGDYETVPAWGARAVVLAVQNGGEPRG